MGSEKSGRWSVSEWRTRREKEASVRAVDSSGCEIVDVLMFFPRVGT